jgi:hypothetical protein
MSNFLALFQFRTAVPFGYFIYYSALLIGFNWDESRTKRAQLRVLRYDSELRIIVEDFEDPDIWDGHLGFRRP